MIVIFLVLGCLIKMEEVLIKTRDSYRNHKSFLILWGVLVCASLLISPLISLIVICLGGFKTLQYQSTEITITTKRIMIEAGVLSKTLNTLELWKVNDIQLSQHPLQRLTKEAFISLVTQDRLTPNLTIEALPAPKAREIFISLQDHIEKARIANKVTQITT